MFGKIMSIVGGVGLGAGLLYLLDPESGTRRRRQIMRSIEGLGSGITGGASNLLSSAGEGASSAYGSLSSAVGSAGSAASRYLGQARDYAADRSYDARRYSVESLGGEMPHSNALGMTVCALSSVAIGAALMYVFDPKSGTQRRQVAQRYAKEHMGTVSEAVNTGYRKVADKVGTGYESVSGAVTNLAAKVGIGSAEAGAKETSPANGAANSGEGNKGDGNKSQGAKARGGASTTM